MAVVKVKLSIIPKIHSGIRLWVDGQEVDFNVVSGGGSVVRTMDEVILEWDAEVTFPGRYQERREL